MGRRVTHKEAAARFRERGLELLEEYRRRDAELRCRCQHCGTTRWVKLSNLSRPGSVACRWCHGWEKWEPWSIEARTQAEQWRKINTSPEDSLAAVERIGLIAITPPGDEFTPIGFLCPRCGETGVTVPDRIGTGERGWFGCPRCLQAQTAETLAEAPAIFEANGLKLLGRCRGEYVPQAAECLECGTPRRVSLAALKDGTAPLCWVCTYGIRPDEPHRVYLAHFPSLGAMKIGLTHARHDRRLADHELAGGKIVAVVDVQDRATARRVERLVLDRYSDWTLTGLTVVELAQGGWTETWSDAAPALDLEAEMAQAIDTS